MTVIRRARQIPVTDAAACDYADGFEITVAADDARSAEQLARYALEHSPPHIRSTIWFVHKYVIRFRLADRDDSDHVAGWTILAVDRESIELQAVSPILRAVLVAERPEPTRAVVTTCLLFVRPTVARAVWALVGPLHRRVARYLLQYAANSQEVLVR